MNANELRARTPEQPLGHIFDVCKAIQSENDFLRHVCNSLATELHRANAVNRMLTAERDEFRDSLAQLRERFAVAQGARCVLVKSKNFPNSKSVGTIYASEKVAITLDVSSHVISDFLVLRMYKYSTNEHLTGNVFKCNKDWFSEIRRPKREEVTFDFFTDVLSSKVQDLLYLRVISDGDVLFESRAFKTVRKRRRNVADDCVEEDLSLSCDKSEFTNDSQTYFLLQSLLEYEDTAQHATNCR